MRFIVPRLRNSSFGNTGIRARQALLRKTAALNAFSSPFLKSTRFPAGSSARQTATVFRSDRANVFRSDRERRAIDAARRERGATARRAKVLSLSSGFVDQPRKASKREQIALCSKPRHHAVGAVRDKRVVSKFLTLVHVGDVNFQHRSVERAKRV